MTAAQTTPARPNIVFVTTDQHRADCFGFENKAIHTPHIDRLAQRGTRFSACITPSVVCQPARASILTGLLPLTHGAWDNGVDLPLEEGDQGFAARLAASGYHTGFIGKAHFSSKVTFAPTGRPECQHSSKAYSPDWNGPYMGFGHVELATLGKFHRNKPPSPPPSGQHFERWFFGHGSEAIQLWADSLNDGTGAAQTWDSALPPAWHCTTWTTDRALDYLRARSPNADPFCLWVSYADPHHPFDCPAPWSQLHSPADVPLPRHRVRDLDKRPWWHEAALNANPLIADPELARFRKQGFNVQPQSDAQLAHMTANYYGMISMVDDGFGRIMDCLRQQGILDNTIVVFASDHGEYLGDHGLYLKGPMMYESVLRVGMVMAGPGIPQDQVIDQPVSTLDLAPTFMQWADVEPTQGLHGQSLLPLIHEGAQREAARSEWRVHPARLGFPLDLRVVRTERYKCTFELCSAAGELYDLQEDPYEMVNRFGDPAIRDVQEHLHALMLARPGALRDTLAEPVGIA